MIKRGQVFVRGIGKDGKWKALDVLDPDEESFRAFVLDMFVKCQTVVALKPEYTEGEEIIYRERAE